jgi:glycosyltransferase involved in cell wall biosynthesis
LIIYCKKYYEILKNSNVLTLSNFQKQYLINDGFDSKNLKILHNPLNINGNDNNQKSINLSSKSYIIYAGLISEEKGIRSLIDTYNLLNKYEKKLVIVGEGPLLETFKKENMNNQIIFLGKQSNIQVLNLIKNSYSVITNTKLYEGQPTLLSEASMLGINSVYPRNGGIVEFFPKDNPFSFEVNSTKDLLDKFSLLQNSELVESQSNENFLHIEKALSKETYLNSFREIVKW